MSNDRIIADFAKTLRMYAGFDEGHCRNRYGTYVELTLLRAAQAGLDSVILAYLALDCPDYVLAELTKIPGRKHCIVHYAKSIECPRYFRAAE